MVKTAERERRLPQAIAHRGYSARWPENTMGAFKGAVSAGAHAIETDVHLTADGVAVQSHVSQFQSGRHAHPLLRHQQGPQGLHVGIRLWARNPPPARPGLASPAGSADVAGRRRGRDEPPVGAAGYQARRRRPRSRRRHQESHISQVPSSRTPWEERILLGCWNASVLQACRGTLPAFPLVHIGYSLSYARHFLPVPHVSFNLAFHTLVRPFYGRRFMRHLAGLDRPLYAWTVNHPRWMRWCIRQNVLLLGGNPGSAKAIDGVVTDDPRLYLDMCKRYEDELDGRVGEPPRASLGEAVGLLVDIVRRHFVMKLFFWYRRHVEGKLDHLGQRRVKKE